MTVYVGKILLAGNNMTTLHPSCLACSLHAWRLQSSLLSALAGTIHCRHLCHAVTVSHEAHTAGRAVPRETAWCHSTGGILPTRAEAHRAKPTARGPVSTNLGDPMATAYTTATSKNVMTASHPNAIPCNNTYPTSILGFCLWSHAA